MGHQVCWLELRIHRLHEPLRCRVPVRCTQLMLWRSLCWGRRCLLSERGRIRLRVWSRLTLRQERVSSRSLRCLNSSAPPLPKVRGRTFWSLAGLLLGSSLQITCACIGCCLQLEVFWSVAYTFLITTHAGLYKHSSNSNENIKTDSNPH